MSTVLPPVYHSSKTPDSHPVWCSRKGCQMPDGALFHTRDIAEKLTMRDADAVNDPFTAWVAVESIDDGAPHVRVSLSPSRDRPHDMGLELTPAEAIALGEALVRAGTWTNGRVG